MDVSRFLGYGGWEIWHVVATPSGWWDTANATGQSANALTPDGVTALGHRGDFHDALVEVELLT